MTSFLDKILPRRHTPRHLLTAQKHAAQLTKYVVDANGCWLWTGSCFKDGYGQMKRSGKNLRAHRVFYETFVGPIPEGLQVLHKCDTPRCVNPDHLFVGTNLENIKDRDNKKRTHQSQFKHIKGQVNVRHEATKIAISESCLRGRLKRGWPLEVALTEPADRTAPRVHFKPRGDR